MSTEPEQRYVFTSNNWKLFVLTSSGQQGACSQVEAVLPGARASSEGSSAGGRCTVLLHSFRAAEQYNVMSATLAGIL